MIPTTNPSAGPEEAHNPVTDRLLVSSDILGNSHSCVISACDTMTRGRHVKTLAWYDNEWAYAHRLVDPAAYIDASRHAAAAR